jgi:hypothetical protein
MDEERGKSHGWFIQKNQLGVGHQGAANNSHLLLSAADKPSDLIALFSQSREVVIHCLQPLFDGLAVPSKMGANLEILLDGKMFKDPSPFNHLDDAHLGDLFGLQAVDAPAHKLNRPVSDLPVFMFQQTGDSLEGGALAGSIGPKESHNASFRHFDGNPLKHQDDLVVLDLNIIDL